MSNKIKKQKIVLNSFPKSLTKKQIKQIDNTPIQEELFKKVKLKMKKTKLIRRVAI